MKAMTLMAVLCGLTLLSGGDALAKTGAKIDDSGDTGDDRDIEVNYHLTLEGYAFEPNYQFVTFSGAWGETVSNMDFCWKQTDQSLWVCHYNELPMTDGDGDWVGYGLISEYTVGTTLLNGNKIFRAWSFDNEFLEDQGLDPIECDVEYTFRLDNGIFKDDLTTTMPCPEEEEVIDESECTECPFGGEFDEENCYLGQAPSGTFAGISGDQFVAYNAASQLVGTYGTIDEDASAFIYNNGFYFVPECEDEVIDEPIEECTECPFGGTYDGLGCAWGSAPTGWSASIDNGYFAFGFYNNESNISISTADDCWGTLLRSGACGVALTPKGTESFVDGDTWYYEPVCE